MGDRIARNGPSSYWECLGISEFSSRLLVLQMMCVDRKLLGGLVWRNGPAYFDMAFVSVMRSRASTESAERVELMESQDGLRQLVGGADRIYPLL